MKNTLICLCFVVISSCSGLYDKRPFNELIGSWSVIDSYDADIKNTLTFDWNGKYYDSNTGNEVWNYEFIEPDSLILYHHAFYEERYKILNLTEDTLTVKLSESIFHAVDMGEEIEAPYGDGSMPIYTYIRINHNTLNHTK